MSPFTSNFVTEKSSRDKDSNTHCPIEYHEAEVINLNAYPLMWTC